MKKYNIDDTETKYDSTGFEINGLHKDTKTKYDSNGFDKDGKHKDTGVFLDKKKYELVKR